MPDTGPAAPWARPAVEVVLDTSPPTLALIGPVGGEWAGATVSVESTEELAGWRAVLYDAQGGAVAVGVIADEGARTLHLLVPDLGGAGGRGRLEVRATDLAGNQSAASREVVLGPDPFWGTTGADARFALSAWTSRRYEARASATSLPPPWSPPMPTRERQAYRVSEVVYLRVRVCEPGTTIPADPASVTLESLALRDAPVPLMGDVDLTRSQAGLYYLPVDTTGFAAGTYDWSVLLADEDANGAVAEGYFVLEEAGA
jgi:hypothetical protein